MNTIKDFLSRAFLINLKSELSIPSAEDPLGQKELARRAEVFKRPWKRVVIIHRDVLDEIERRDNTITMCFDQEENIYAMSKDGIYRELVTISDDEYDCQESQRGPQK